MLSKKTFTVVVAVALIFKIFLFVFAALKAPESKFLFDSQSYLVTSQYLVSDGVFAIEKNGNKFSFDNYRTPGYPLFLALFHRILRIPLEGIIFIQILLTLSAAFIVFKAACLIDRRCGWLSAVIMIIDPNITVHAQTILTESLFLLVISTIMYCTLAYFKNRTFKMLLMITLLLVMAVYVRPVAYYCGVPLLLILIYAGKKDGLKKIITHTLIFVIIVCGLIGLWQLRNYKRFGRGYFTSIPSTVVKQQGIYKSYARNKDPYSQGLSPAMYYANVTTRCAVSFLTRPVSFKYFNSRGLIVAGKIFSYPWIVFWMVGLGLGLITMPKNKTYIFLLIMILYFMIVSVMGGMWGIGSRFRIPAMPFISIITAYGWLWIFVIRKES